MKLKLYFLFIFLSGSLLHAQDNTVSADSLFLVLRVKYYQAVEESDSLAVLQKIINDNIDNTNPLISEIIPAYSAAVLSLKAKHAFWPFTKLKYLERSMDKFGQIIKENPDNLEIRFMRFSILHYVPDFLGWNDEKEFDREKIISLIIERRFDNIPSDVMHGIKSFMLESGRLTEKESNLLIETNLASLIK